MDFYVMSREQYERFAAGGERVEPGDYCLVFDNRDAGDGAQAVAAEFHVTYEQTAAP